MGYPRDATIDAWLSLLLVHLSWSKKTTGSTCISALTTTSSYSSPPDHARSIPGFGAPLAFPSHLPSLLHCHTSRCSFSITSLHDFLSKAGTVSHAVWKANKDGAASILMLHHHYAQCSATCSREAEGSERCNSSFIYHTCDALFLSNEDARRGY